jgi:hypothetical protein
MTCSTDVIVLADPAPSNQVTPPPLSLVRFSSVSTVKLAEPDRDSERCDSAGAEDIVKPHFRWHMPQLALYNLSNIVIVVASTLFGSISMASASSIS